jgi:hypothetical protein
MNLIDTISRLKAKIQATGADLLQHVAGHVTYKILWAFHSGNDFFYFAFNVFSHHALLFVIKPFYFILMSK